MSNTIKRIHIGFASYWCKIFHKQHHQTYWFDYSKLFNRCKKCGVHHSEPRT